MAINSHSSCLVSLVLFFVCCESARTMSTGGEKKPGVFNGSVGADGGVQNAIRIKTPLGSVGVSHGANASIEGGVDATTSSNAITPIENEKNIDSNADAGANAGFQIGAGIKTPIGMISASHGANASIGGGGGVGATSTSNIVAPVRDVKLQNLGWSAGAIAGFQNGAAIKTPIGTIGASHGANASIGGGGGVGATSTSNIVASVGDEKLLNLRWNVGANEGFQNGAGIKTPFGPISASHGANASIGGGGGAGATYTSNIVGPVGDEKFLNLGWSGGAKAGINGNAGINTPLGSAGIGLGANGGANAGSGEAINKPN